MKKPALKEIEFQPDAWQRFERAVSVVMKAPPQHRKAKAKPPKSPKKKATRKRG